MGWRVRASATLYVALLPALELAAGRLPHAEPLRALVFLLLLPAGLLRIPLEPALEVLDLRAAWLPYAEIAVLGLSNVLLLRGLYRLLPPDRAAQRVAERLGYALTAPGVPVTPMAHDHGPRRAGTGEVRMEQSLLLRDVPIPLLDLLGVYREHWLRAGLQVQERADPPGVRAGDRDGYEYLLEPGPGPAHLGEAVLRVASPPRGRRAFWGGLATGVGPALLLALTGLALHPRGVVVAPMAALALVGPASLAVGIVLLTRYRTRPFGHGLLLGGAPGALLGGLYAVTAF